ncbi:MAG TPA: discoidin domain-containing protein [Candidatus Alistipes faecigallinarum]|nr:discoidin domain-containing protein [Candidatus Alistipes faecigallinarum]
MTKRLQLLLGLALFATGALCAQPRIALDSRSGHIRWEVRPVTETTGLPAVEAIVPGSVFTSYVAAGVEADPNFGDNAYRVDKSRYDRDFLYTGTFKTPEIGAGRTLWLHFEGVNRKGTVRLNGHTLGHLDGFMQRGDYDITGLVRPGGENRLEVEVEWVGLPVPNLRSPTYIASSSWDWMPYVPGLLSGITDDVYLTTTGDVRLIDPWIRTKVPDREHARIEILAELENRSSKPLEGTLEGEIAPGGIRFSQPVRLGAGERRTVRLTEREVAALAVEHPRLWWPNGMGDPDLYTCRLAFNTGTETSDSREITFGIREYGYEYDADGIFRLKINGEKVFVKGGNWGMSEWLLRCRGEEYDTRVALHRHMHFNMIRNWIGSTTDEEFYDACDRYGIMVWDDFWLNSHPNLPQDLEAFQRNAVEKIKRLRNHASIAVWCGDNEGVPLAPLDDWLRGDVAYYDGGDRHYHSISNAQGLSGSGPWANFHPSWYFTPYPMPYGYKGRPAWGFRTEIGTAVFTTFESFRRFMPEESWWPRNEMWDKHFFGKSAANAAPDKYFETVAENYGEPTGIEDFCRKAQLLNLESNKAMYEGWQHHLWDDATGIMTWMSQSAYPSLVWQTYDYYFDPTGAYWGVRKACEPVHIQWSHADNTVKAINTTREAVDAVATARVYDLDGRLLPQFTQQIHVSLEPNTARYLFDLNFAQGNLARNRPVRASSSSRDGAGAQALTDGNEGSRWSSEYRDDEWIEVDLGAVREFSEVVLRWEDAHAAAYRLQLSDDGTAWRDVYETQQAPGGEETLSLGLQQARYIRMQGIRRATQWGYSLYEMEVYRHDAATPRLSPVHFIRLELTDRDGKPLSENFYWRATRRGDYTALNTLAPARLQVRSKLTAEGDRKVIRTTVRNTGRSVAFAIHLQPYRLSDGERILPYEADDNYFTLLPGESRTIDFRFDGSLLPDDRYEVRAEAYNR